MWQIYLRTVWGMALCHSSPFMRECCYQRTALLLGLLLSMEMKPLPKHNAWSLNTCQQVKEWGRQSKLMIFHRESHEYTAQVSHCHTTNNSITLRRATAGPVWSAELKQEGSTNQNKLFTHGTVLCQTADSIRGWEWWATNRTPGKKTGAVSQSNIDCSIKPQEEHPSS